MAAGAQLSIPDMRRAARHPVDFPVIGEHRGMGDVHLRIVNISPHGFMAREAPQLGRGERLVIRLPAIGRIEAHLIWSTTDRAGFQFERVLRFDDFMNVIDTLQPNPRLRTRR
jgi:hypothetical protein